MTVLFTFNSMKMTHQQMMDVSMNATSKDVAGKGYTHLFSILLRRRDLKPTAYTQRSQSLPDWRALTGPSSRSDDFEVRRADTQSSHRNMIARQINDELVQELAAYKRAFDRKYKVGVAAERSLQEVPCSAIPNKTMDVIERLIMPLLWREAESVQVLHYFSI